MNERVAFQEDVPERVPRLVISCESSRGTNPAIIAAAEEVCRVGKKNTAESCDLVQFA